MSSWVRSKSWLAKKLKELKNECWSENYCDIISKVISHLIDYENNTQDWEFDEYTNKFASEDLMQDYTKYRAEKFWFSQVARDLRDVEYDDDYYLIDDTYGDVRNIDEKDVIERIDDILSDFK